MMDAASASAWTMLGLALGLLALPRLAEAEGAALSEATRLSNARMMAEYFEEMCIPKPFDPRRGEEFQKHRDAIRARLLADLGLSPLPERVPLDLRYSEPLEHEWASVRRVYYQLWPGVYAHGLLYMPKAFREKPAPAMLCPAGHFPDSNLYKGEQARALFFARLGYVVFAPFQSHYEDMSLGVSQQTLLVWQNMRAIDLLCSLPEVDDARIGSAGCSGGGYQTAMMLALEPRVVVGSDVGYSEEYRSILFPQTSHCVCNHIPNVMRYTDQTEISCLGMPKPIQYMVMNDQTKFFPYSHYPIVQDLFRVNGASGRTDVAYFDTPHDYARPKRERTYWWMEKWLRGVESSRFPEEPATLEDEGTFPVRAFDKLMLSFPENKGWRAISDYYRERYLFKAPEIAARADWEAYRARMRAALADLLGEAAQLPSRNEKPKGRGGEESPPAPLVKGGAEEVVEVRFPSEGGLMLPASVVLPRKTGRRAPIVLMVSGDGRDWLLAGEGPGSPRALAREGNLVVVLDTRFIGELDWRHYERLFATKEEGERILTYEHIRYLNAVSPRAWERNSIVWGRPIAGMMATDLIRTLDGVLKHLGSAGADGVDGGDVTVITRDSADLAVAALFAAALDERIRRVDADLADACFAKTETFGGWWLPPGYDPSVRPANGLSMVPFILRHGDVLQWAALSADRQMVLRNLPAEAGDAGWLSGVFAAVGNARGVTIEKTVPPTGEMIHVKSERDGSLSYSWTPGAAPAKAPKVVPFRGGWGLKFDAGRQNELILFSPPLTRGEEGETTAPPLMKGDGGDSSRFWKTRGPLTLQMVVRPEKLVVAEAALFSKWIATDGKRAVFLGLNNRGRIYWAVSGSGRADRQRRHVQSPHRLEAGKSYALAAVYDPGRRLAIYINGHLSVETAQDVPERVFDCDSPVMLGSRPGQTHADVVIGEVRLSPRALEEADIARWARELELTERPGERFLWERAVFAPDAASAPVRALTTGPKPHWFGYYDKFQTDPTDRYVLSLEADFDLRLPVVGDVARIGMIDTQDGNKWIPLAETGAWNWQQGCMLQWRPGSDREIIYNDREGERFVARILDVSTGRTRTLPRAVGHVSPDGKYALCEDFARMRAMRPVIGYAVADPTQYLKEAAPADSGVWLMDLETGESRIVVSMADVARIPYPNQTPADRLYCNHTQWSPDGKRFLFIARGDNINSRMMTANRDGSELRPLTHGASHFDWLDGQHILVEMRGGFFLFRDDGSMRGRNILAVPAGHQSYLPGHRWLVSDTIPMGPEREQHPYLVEFLSSPLSKGYRGDESDVRIVPLGHFHQPPEYSGDVRCDNHPRQSRDGRKIIIDSAHSGTRQMYMIDIAGIVGRLAAGGS